MENETRNFSQQDIQSTKGLAILSYFGPLFLIPMLVNKDSAFTKFHVNQGMVLLIIMVIFNVAGTVLHFIPVVGSLVRLAIRIATMVLIILGAVNAARGEAQRLPIIGNIEIYR